MWGTMTPYDKHKSLIIKVLSKINGGEGGIRTHVPVTRQDAFEAPPLRPLRYLSVRVVSRESSVVGRSSLVVRRWVDSSVELLRIPRHPIFRGAPEKAEHQLTRLLAKHPLDHLHSMIVSRMVERPHDRSDGAGPWFGCAEDESANTGVHERAGTHQARLDGDIERRPGQTIVSDIGRAGPKCHDLGMGRRIDSSDRLIVAGAYHTTVADEHRADWNLADVEGARRLAIGQTHPGFVLRLVQDRHSSIVSDRLLEPHRGGCGSRRASRPPAPSLHRLFVDPDADLSFLFRHPDDVTTQRAQLVECRRDIESFSLT